LVFVGVCAFAGWARGLIVSALSLAGFVGGALIGARLGPYFLPQGSDSAYTPLVALACALVAALLVQWLAISLGMRLRGLLRPRPLRLMDAAGGLGVGIVTGLAIAWIVGAMIVLLPGHPDWQRAVRQSGVLRRLDSIVPPSAVLDLLARIDPFPTITGLAIPTTPPTRSILGNPVLRRAEPSIVRVLGIACGLGVEGSGWVVKPGVVVTAAHVVAGETTTTVASSGSGHALDSHVIAFDRHDDLALLSVPGLHARPLPTASPVQASPAAIVGFPENGPLTATPARTGPTQRVFAADAYGHGPVQRTITSLAGQVRPGNSGGPLVDSNGRVTATIFAANTTTEGGYATPTRLIPNLLAHARQIVSTGACAG
jgi:S1-C subfamily serine protease